MVRGRAQLKRERSVGEPFQEREGLFERATDIGSRDVRHALCARLGLAASDPFARRAAGVGIGAPSDARAAFADLRAFTRRFGPSSPLAGAAARASAVAPAAARA